MLQFLVGILAFFTLGYLFALVAPFDRAGLDVSLGVRLIVAGGVLLLSYTLYRFRYVRSRHQRIAAGWPLRGVQRPG
jgi:hypothetical protein